MPTKLRLSRACLVALALTGLPGNATAGPDVGVAVVRGATWSPDDPARAGAGEFLVLLRTAQLQRAHRAAGLVAVGDRRGVLVSGGEQALRRAALSGVAVARIARGGAVAWTPDDLFLDAGDASEAEVEGALGRGLARHGAPPAARDPDHPTRGELAAIRAHLGKLQAYFAR